MDNADETSRSPDDIVGQMSDAARDLISAGRAMLDGAERMLNESGERPDRVNIEQTIQRWVQLGQAAVAGFVEESSAATSTEDSQTRAPSHGTEPIVGINLTDNRSSTPTAGSDAQGTDTDSTATASAHTDEGLHA